MPCVSLRGRVGGDSKPRPKQCPITSPDRPGPLVFQRATLKNWVGPGYEASYNDEQIIDRPRIAQLWHYSSIYMHNVRNNIPI